MMTARIDQAHSMIVLGRHHEPIALGSDSVTFFDLDAVKQYLPEKGKTKIISKKLISSHKKELTMSSENFYLKIFIQFGE